MSKWTVVLVIGGAAVLGAIALFKAWPVLNVVETGRTPEYPDLQPAHYRARVDHVFDAALRTISLMPRWTLISSWREQGEVRAEARTRLFRFVDDVTVRMEERDGLTVVQVRSASRVGRSDFGQNARNIRAFFAEMDRQMNAARGS